MTVKTSEIFNNCVKRENLKKVNKDWKDTRNYNRRESFKSNHYFKYNVIVKGQICFKNTNIFILIIFVDYFQVIYSYHRYHHREHYRRYRSSLVF